uniref:LSDAT_euk domain-containing protein n=1 Tax=Macrostomum lignano TaxID=282301 RepID=A0A1I8FS39_9PLAT
RPERAARSNGGVVGSKPQLTGDELDANHTHFILVSGRHSDATSWSEAVEAEADFRARFFQSGSQQQLDAEGRGGEPVPMCGLLIGGDRTALRQVYQALVANRCPIVALKVTNPGGSDSHEHKLNLKQLKISLALNRADIAREKIFLENKKKNAKKGDLHDCM